MRSGWIFFQASLLVDADGEVVRPWVAWFIDVATKAITGTAVTPGHLSRASILAALRAAVLRTGPYGPAGGIPWERVLWHRTDWRDTTELFILTALRRRATRAHPRADSRGAARNAYGAWLLLLDQGPQAARDLAARLADMLPIVGWDNHRQDVLARTAVPVSG
ncbi:hypothetical protein [Streptomyces sp. NPDC088762]|uniref:hypothetical protein n=1 Tax=Streptomyces sp. NPDC088762 TaxID=3365891 RepID=UPI00382B5C4F